MGLSVLLGNISSCSDDVRISVVQRPKATTDAGVSHIVLGSKIVIIDPSTISPNALAKDDLPFITVPPSKICSDVSFYNAEGEILKGELDCSGEALLKNISAEQIRKGVTIASIVGTLEVKPADCLTDGELECVTTERFRALEVNSASAKILQGYTLGLVQGSYTPPSYALCSSNGAVDCLTHSGFKAADLSQFTAGSIRSGITIAGQLGAYPSASFRLEGATALPDLSNWSVSLPLGTYEFFDSAGQIYQGTLADASGLMPTTSLQTIAASGTLYRQLSLVGDSDFVASNIEGGVAIFGMSGILTASPPNCVSETDVACLVDGSTMAAAELSGAAAKIRSTQSLAGVSGSFLLPAATSVRTGIAFGTSGSEFNGSLTLPPAAAVHDDNGPYGTAATGTTPTFPTCGSDGATDCVALGPTYAAALLASAADKIISGQSMAGVSGNVLVPPAAKVLSGQSYGVLGTNTSGTLSLPLANKVLLGSGLYGDASAQLTPSLSPDFPDAQNVLASTTVNSSVGLLADCSTNSETGCYIRSSGTLRAGNLSNLSAANIRNTVVIAGVTGSVVETTANCASAGAQDCVATGSYFAGTVCGANGSQCFIPTFASGSQSLKAINFDAIDAGKANIRSSLSLAGVSGTLGDCAANAAADCYINSATSYRAAQLANLSATNVRTGVVLAGTTGSLVESPAACGSSGSQSCVASGSYFAAPACSANASTCYIPTYAQGVQALKAISYDALDADKAAFRSNLTLGGVVGTLADCAANSSSNCYVNSAAAYRAADVTNLSAGNIKSGIILAGVTGSLTETPANCSSPGSQSCVATGSYFAATSCAANGSLCYLPSYVTSTQPLKAVSYDAIDTGKAAIRSNLTIGGVTGTLADCAANSTADCYAASSSSYKAANLTNLSSTNVKSGVVLAGVTGNLVEAPANCSSGGAQNCVAAGSYFAATACAAQGSNCYVPAYVLSTQSLKALDYDAIDTSKMLSTQTVAGKVGTLTSQGSWNLSASFPGAGVYSGVSNTPGASSIKNASSILGVTGVYPSATAALATATAATDLTLFTTQLTSAGSFEFFDSSGNQYTGSGDADIIATNIKTAVALENFSITGTYAGTAPDPWDLRAGVTVGGVTGQLKMNCRNRANSSIYNSDLDPPGNAGIVTGTTVDWWDTISDRNDNGPFPTTLVAGWTSTTDCDKGLWQDITPDGACDTAADDCLIKDRVSNLTWTEGYPVTGLAPATTTINWSNAVQHCAVLNYGGHADWRMPTIKELSAAYVHSIRNVYYQGVGTIRPSGDTLDNNDLFIPSSRDYWSATSYSENAAEARWMAFDNGIIPRTAKTNLKSVLCVRP